MPVNVVMPQMGESVAEGTVVRWIKKIGDNVDRDEPLFEISTDKVDAEIPSPAAGTLSAIHVKEGETVPVDTVVALIAQPGEAAASASAGGGAAPNGAAASGPASASGAASGGASPSEAAKAATPAKASTPSPASSTSAKASTPPPASSAPNGYAVSPGAGPGAPAVATLDIPRGELSRDELRRQRSSPLVRKIAREHNVDISQITGSGISGRVTKHDILKFLEHPRPAMPATAHAPASAPAAARGGTTPIVHVPAYNTGDAVELVPMSVMRKKIAEHMVTSVHTSAHVYSVFEVDFTQVSKIRAAKKDEYERAGTKLTFLSFIAKATVDALRAAPILNTSIDGETIVYKKDVNVGIAVALDWGLIVPVIKHADEKNLLGLSRAIADLAARARAKKLKPEEVQGGTFTITNPGTFGAQFGMPIINQPQVAILGVGAIEKRAVVIDDAIAIRPRAYLTLGYDHRLIDGAVADQFMSLIKQTIENFDPAAA
jgi:pyruvate dehydrogenase E2 component (dihydrolipoyllysine-residue acetyltransferase)